jgi:gluconate 5-dehydrogenase
MSNNHAFDSKKGCIDLTGYTALITGASSGMGYEMAKELLSHGATVIIGARGGAKLDKAYTQLSLQGFDV